MPNFTETVYITFETANGETQMEIDSPDIDDVDYIINQAAVMENVTEYTKVTVTNEYGEQLYSGPG